MRILFVEPYANSLLSCRKELLDTLIERGHKIYLCLSSDDRVDDLYKNKVKEIIDVKVNLKNVRLFYNLRLLFTYKKIITRIKPELIISYSIKPNAYCGHYAKDIPMIANVTGLGKVFNKSGFLSKLCLWIYRKTFRNIQYVFFQNKESYDFLSAHKVRINNYKIIPGSGVNVDKFAYAPLTDDKHIKFLFASRAIREKGIDLIYKAIPIIVNEYPNARFSFLEAEDVLCKGKKEKEFFEQYHDYIKVLPRSNDMPSVYAKHDFLLSPSYYKEGISNVLLESLSVGRPILTTYDNPGCKEVLVDGENGYGMKSNDFDSLVLALRKACETPKEKIIEMGINGREFVDKHFNRNIVINEYLDAIDRIKGEINDKRG